MSEIIAYLPPYIEQEVIEDDEEGFENLDDASDKTKVIPNENGLKNKEELEALLRPLDATTDRDHWMQLMASAYNMAENKEDALEKAMNDIGVPTICWQCSQGSIRTCRR